MTLASFNVLITIGRILGSFTLGIIYSSFKWGRSTRKAIAHEAATNISSSKPFALVSSNALRTEGNTTALLIWLGKSDRPLAAILVPAFSTSGGEYFRIWFAFSRYFIVGRITAVGIVFCVFTLTIIVFQIFSSFIYCPFTIIYNNILASSLLIP